MVGRYNAEYEDYLHHKFSTPPLVIVTDTRSIAIGPGLTFSEADWLRRYLRYALAQYSGG